LVGTIKTDYQTIKSTKTVFKKGDILYGKLRPNLNKVYLAEQDGICSTDILVFRFENINLAYFYKYYLMLPVFNNEVLKTVSGQQLPRTSWTDIKEIKIPFIKDVELTNLVASIQTIEANIAAAQQIINTTATQKAAVMAQYL
jgi:restriction endonuclease S subunit